MMKTPFLPRSGVAALSEVQFKAVVMSCHVTVAKSLQPARPRSAGHNGFPVRPVSGYGIIWGGRNLYADG